jgi:hypothetical protein
MRKFLFVFLTGAFLTVFLTGLAHGASGSIDLSTINPLACTDLGCVAGKIISAIYYISIPIVSIMVLWGGFQILSAGGNPEQVKTGGKTILYAAVGFIVILLAGGVVDIIKSIVQP